MKLNESLVSVIVPVYNAEKYLKKCMESILKQTYENIELILINDGSIDKSLDICNQFSKRDRRIRVIDKDNSGVSDTRNLGIMLAKGKYLCFVDSDDYIEENYIEKMILNTDESTLTMCGYFIETSMENGDFFSRKVTYKEKEIISIKEHLANLFHQGFLSAIWNKIYDVERLKKNDIKFDENLSLGEDLLFNLEYLKTGIEKFKCIDLPLYHYIKRGTESLDNKYREDFLKIQEKLYEKLIETSELYKLSATEKSLIYIDFMSAIIVSIDNCYIFNNSSEMLKKAEKSACQSIEKHKIMDSVSGKMLLICKFRLVLLKLGFFKIDYLLRKIVKKVLKVA